MYFISTFFHSSYPKDTHFSLGSHINSQHISNFFASFTNVFIRYSLHTLVIPRITIPDNLLFSLHSRNTFDPFLNALCKPTLMLILYLTFYPCNTPSSCTIIYLFLCFCYSYNHHFTFNAFVIPNITFLLLYAILTPTNTFFTFNTTVTPTNTIHI